ncbi:MAG: putative exported protein [Cenarchaeum symbiont of Oopsacas minuta]|nr:putative exported protein [Cenarchaeum symbiont of Oopsacas minuta]
MATRAQALIPIAIAATIIGIAGLVSIPEDSKLESVDFPRGTIALDGKFLEVQIADTEPRRVRGLMFQEGLKYDEGMIFEFETKGVHSMWMPNMQFPLDIIWFDADGNIVHIEENVSPCTTVLDTRSCTVSNDNNTFALYVLELAAGYVQMFGITTESILEIISI